MDNTGKIVNKNIQIKVFKLYYNSDVISTNEWLKEHSEKIEILDIKEVATKEYVRMIIYFTNITNKGKHSLD